MALPTNCTLFNGRLSFNWILSTYRSYDIEKCLKSKASKNLSKNSSKICQKTRQKFVKNTSKRTLSQNSSKNLSKHCQKNCQTRSTRKTSMYHLCHPNLDSKKLHMPRKEASSLKNVLESNTKLHTYVERSSKTVSNQWSKSKVI